MERITGQFKGHDLDTILKDLELQQETTQTTAAVTVPAIEPYPTPSVTSSSPSITLEALVDEFQRMKVETGKWHETTVMRHKPKLEALMQVLGKKRIFNPKTFNKWAKHNHDNRMGAAVHEQVILFLRHGDVLHHQLRNGK